MRSQPKRQRRKPKDTTQVSDRIAGLSLGREARSLLDVLRAYGADPSQVPDPRNAEACRQWQAVRAIRPPARATWGDDPTTTRTIERSAVPPWVLDWAAAILAQSPGRQDRRPKPPGRPPDPDTEAVEFLGIGGGTAPDNARFFLKYRAIREGRSSKDVEEDKVQRVDREAREDADVER